MSTVYSGNTNEMNNLWVVKSKGKSIRRKFLRKHEQFINRTVSNALGKMAINTNSIEFGIGLNAFNFSIDAYHSNDYNSFLRYATEIIESWLNEYQSQDLKIFREDIVILKNKLWEFGLTIKDLIALTPKRSEAIRQAVSDARFIISKEAFFKKISFRKRLSEEETLELLKIIEKTVKKNQKYVLAIILISLSDLTRLKNYLKDISEGNYVDNNMGSVIEFSKGKAIVMTEGGRFIHAVSVCELYLGQQFYEPKLQSFKANQRRIKFSLIAAGFTFVILASFFYMKLADQNGLNANSKAVTLKTSMNNEQTIETESPSKEVSLKGKENKQEEKKKDTKVKQEEYVTESQSPKPGSGGKVQTTHTKKNNTKVGTIPVSTSRTSGPEKSKASPKVNEINKVTTNTPEITEKNITTEIPLPTPTKYIKPSIEPVPTDYKTVKANGVPDRIMIDSELREAQVGQEFTIVIRIPKGNNATTWTLYENDSIIATWHYPDNSPNEQMAMRLVTARQPGTFKYKSVLSNTYGSSVSDEITVVVK